MPSACTATLIQIVLQVSVVASLAISAFAARRGRSVCGSRTVAAARSASVIDGMISLAANVNPAWLSIWPHPPRYALPGFAWPANSSQPCRTKRPGIPTNRTHSVQRNPVLISPIERSVVDRRECVASSLESWQSTGSYRLSRAVTVRANRMSVEPPACAVISRTTLALSKRP